MAICHLNDHPRYAGITRIDHLDRIRLSIVAGILSHGSAEDRQTLRDWIDDQPLAAMLEAREVRHA